MSNLRFKVGTSVMCNLGPGGWKQGKIIALHYREDHWPKGETAPYQVALEPEYSLIYVPEDDDRFCREPTFEDLRIAGRKDALAGYGEKQEGKRSKTDEMAALAGCSDETSQHESISSYRNGKCFCCNGCPTSWSSVELYSEHYRCASRNNLKITQHEIKLGTVHVGNCFNHLPDENLPSKEGFMQCPTLVRLPPGVTFSDGGGLSGIIRFDPHREASYIVEFVAVSTANWQDDAIGIVRLEISFTVEGNKAPYNFDMAAFEQEQKKARAAANKLLEKLNYTWTLWENKRLDNRATCDSMCADLGQLRDHLECHPRLDRGKWWGHLGGYHMNVHKLLENKLFECELYLGYALTFGDDEVRYYVEQNLQGCYQKRLLECARFMWADGCKLMLQGEWIKAADTLSLAAAKKEGWGWAVNHGDIWISEAHARLMYSAELYSKTGSMSGDMETSLSKARDLLALGNARAKESDAIGSGGHPWASETMLALNSFQKLVAGGKDIIQWLEEVNTRTLYWCSQVLAGAAPFPPKPRPRLEDAKILTERLPRYNA